MDNYTTLIQRTISNLAQISKLNPLQKLYVDSVTGYIQVDSAILPGVTRMFYSQDRKMTFVHVEENVTLCMLLIDLLCDVKSFAAKIPDESRDDASIVKIRERDIMYHRLIRALTDAKSGVASLVSTYVTDTAMSSQFNGLLQKMEEFLNNHTKN